MRPAIREIAPLPWNDTSKPTQKAGPWDAPVQDEHGQSAENAAKARGRPSSPEGAKPARHKDPIAPRGPEAPARRPKTQGRLSTPDRKVAGLKTPSVGAPQWLRLDRHIARLRAALAEVVLNPAGGGVRPSVFVAGSATLIAIWALSGVYEVGADQSGMVTRFGAFVGETGPGVRYHLPAPIEAVRKLSVGTVNRLDLGPGEDADASDAAPMLTRDGNAAAVDFSVQWRIVDPYKYLYRVEDPDTFLRRGAEEAMRGAVGEIAFADLTAADDGNAQAKTMARLRAQLERADAGIEVVNVVIRDAAPPESAQAGFHDMAAAREDAQIAARDAGAYRDRVLADARGDVAKTVQASQGYRDQEISEARGEADRFALVDAQYRRFPDVTRERLYTEMMERVLHATSKVIVQSAKGSTGQIVLPPELFRPRPVEPPSQGGAAQGAAGQSPSTSQPQAQPQAQPSATAQPVPTA